jgi:3-oxoacyl-[acyl-carrier protein] reductase
MKLTGAIAIVTGASRGIGRAIAERLAADGAKVVGTATTEKGAASITEALAARGGVGKVLDVRNGAACDALVDEVAKTLGVPGILVNNAGVTRDTLMIRMKDEDWDEVLATDLTSVFRMSRAVLRGMMKARYGRIVNVGSIVGSSGNAGQVNYAAAKAGILGLSKSMAEEVASRGITVNVVAPGFIESDMTAVLSEEVKQNLLQRVPQQRLGKPEEIAAAVAFLVSPEASYVTGQTLHVNGGMLMP